MERPVSYGGVEGGGTKFVCAVGTGPDDIEETRTFPTTTPEVTLAAVTDFFAPHEIAAVGLATFGPIDLDTTSKTYGQLIGTPKPGWSGTNVAGALSSALEVDVVVDTDVNGAALGEGRWGAGQGLDTFLYVTVGTGIGGGGLINGSPMHGLMHPEIGHIRVPRHPSDSFAGSCPLHRDCLEGLASGPAIAARWGHPSDDLGTNTNEAVALQAFYLGTAMANLSLAISPERIILGGGVLGLPGLLEATRAVMVESLAGYLDPVLPDEYLVTPGLGNRSGVLGGFVLAETAG